MLPNTTLIPAHAARRRSMVHDLRPGAPLPFGKALSADVVVTEAGNYDDDDGCKLVISDGALVFLGSFEGTRVTLGVTLERVLAAIEAYTKQHES
jgi:hypothetical protein